MAAINVLGQAGESLDAEAREAMGDGYGLWHEAQGRIRSDFDAATSAMLSDDAPLSRADGSTFTVKCSSTHNGPQIWRTQVEAVLFTDEDLNKSGKAGQAVAEVAEAVGWNTDGGILIPSSGVGPYAAMLLLRGLGITPIKKTPRLDVEPVKNQLLLRAVPLHVGYCQRWSLPGQLHRVGARQKRFATERDPAAACGVSFCVRLLAGRLRAQGPCAYPFELFSSSTSSNSSSRVCTSSF